MKYLCLLLLALLSGCGKSPDRAVLYCAQDMEYAQEILSSFEKETGIPVATKFDTEANKSVSLFEELVQEAKRPRCDVFWNNEIINTIRLERKGLLDRMEPDPNYPAWTRSESGCWQAFAARGRILIVNTEKLKEADYPKSILDLTDPKWKSKLAMAKPQFGTTATHAACLFEVLGEEGAQAFFNGLKVNDITILAGNKQVAERVARGDFAAGLTDTDDAIEEYNDKRPVKLLYLDQEAHPKYPALGTLFIPNTICILKNRPNPENAQKLVKFLLNPGTEDKLALKGGFQIPLSTASQAKLHETLKRPDQVRRMEVSFEKSADRWESVQQFLRDTFAR
jgi:iron(III) transport system substrate-binding protein